MVYVSEERLFADGAQELVLFARMIGLSPGDVRYPPGSAPYVPLEGDLRGRALQTGALPASPLVLRGFALRALAGEWSGADQEVA